MYRLASAALGKYMADKYRLAVQKLIRLCGARNVVHRTVAIGRPVPEAFPADERSDLNVIIARGHTEALFPQSEWAGNMRDVVYSFAKS